MSLPASPEPNPALPTGLPTGLPPTSSETPLGGPDPSGGSPSPGSSPQAILSQLISWAVILGCTGLLMAMVFASQFLEAEPEAEGKPFLLPANFAGQFALGMKSWSRPQAQEMLTSLDTGPIPQRLVRLVILAELAEPAPPPAEDGEERTFSTGKVWDAAAVRREFDELREKISDAKYEATEAEQKLLQATEAVVRAKLADEPLPADDASLQMVVDQLGFAGKLAASWSDANRRATSQLQQQSNTKLVVVTVGFLLVALAALAGLVVLIVLVVLLAMGKLHSRWLSGSGNGYLFLEALAVWFATFVGAQLLIGLAIKLLGQGAADAEGGGGGGVWLTMLLFYVPLGISLLWLRARHPDPSRMWRELGFTTHGLLGDLGKAFTVHLAFLPVLVGAIILTVLLTSVVHGDVSSSQPFAPPKGPAHPIQEQFDGQWSTVLALFLLAAVTAPIVEEIVFRGLFYRYLRDWTGRQWIYFSIFFATVVNGFIFAAIHPQGLLGIPPLMTLAAAMSLSREWSGGLLAPMTIHAINNGVLVVLMAFMFG
jgi:membrane protease YdiL (CAAX protease family)